MKTRIMNLTTTAIGLCIIIMALVMWYLSKIDTAALIIAIPFGWTFISAKDTLLSGVSGGLIKVNDGQNHQ